MLRQFGSLLDGTIPDTPVWTADISYWISGRQSDGSADDAWETEEGYLQLHRDLGIMPYYFYDTFWVAEPVYEDTIELRAGNDNGKDYREIHTPVGAIREESVFLPVSSCYGITKHMVETEHDLDVLLYILENRHLKPCNLADYRDRLKLWAVYDGLPCLGLPRSPLPSLAYEWCGLQSLVMLLLDQHDKISQALDMLEEQEEPILDAVCSLKPQLVHFPDNLSSDNLTGYYDTYMKARHAKRLDRLHGEGIRAAVHLDGTVNGLLPKLVDTGFDAVEALTPSPAGDISAEEMGEIVEGSSTILWGGVPGVMFAPPYSWDDLQRHVEHVLDVWRGRPFVLGVADQVPPDGTIDFCRRIRDMVGG